MEFSDWCRLWAAMDVRNRVGHEIVRAMDDAPTVRLWVSAEWRRAYRTGMVES